MEVSQSKSVVSASSPALGAEMMAKLKPHGIKHTLKVKSLGWGWRRVSGGMPWC